MFCMILTSYSNTSLQTTTSLSTAKRTAYYFSNKGDDNNDGSLLHPKKTIQALNTLALCNGDSVLFKGNEIFYGTIQLKINNISSEKFVLASYGNTPAIVDAGNNTAIQINQSSNISISNIICKGSGRKDGNTKAGVYINQCSNVEITGINISGFQKAGMQLYNCKNAVLNNIYVHDNGAAGISVDGDYENKLGSRDIIITNCKAENNPGDPTNFTNHSGNGIIVGHCTNVLIDHCTATNNGWDMPRIGNGPVGIWCYEADSVIIQHCISYRNKTSKGGEDGGGYDFDGGTTNSIIQYCLSYENQGSAFGIFQYAGAGKWENNVIRFCISENDGKVSSAHAATYIWSSAHDTAHFKNLLFYNNTIYNDSVAAISYSPESGHSNFKFYNNIFIAADTLIRGRYENDIFLSNDWWSLKRGFNIDGQTSFEKWCKTKNKEQLKNETAGLNVNVTFKNAGHANLTNAKNLSGFDNYKIVGASPVLHNALDLDKLYKIDIGKKDFNKLAIKTKVIGACTNQ